MAVAAAPVVVLPEVRLFNQEGPAAPAGNLSDREVEVLQNLSKEKHTQKGRVGSSLLGMAVLILAIWAGMASGSWLVGIGIFIVVGATLEGIYNSLRNSDYLDASEALKMPNFRQYIQRNNLDLSIETIVAVHNRYKNYLSEQINR